MPIDQSTTGTIPTESIDSLIDKRLARSAGTAVRNMTGTKATTTVDPIDAAIDKRIDGGYADDPNIDTTTGLEDGATRAILGFAHTPPGRMKVLTDAGYKAERLEDGRLTYLNPKTKKKTVVDETGMSLGDLADVVHLIPEVGGAVGAGLLTGGNPFAAGMGAMTGKSVEMGIGKALGIDEKQRLLDIPVAGAASLAGDAALGVANKALAPVKKSVMPGAKTANEMLQGAGSGMTAAQMTDNGLVDFFEAMAEGSFGGGPVINRFLRKQRATFGGFLDDIIHGLGNDATPEQVGAIFEKAFISKQSIFNDVLAPALYKRVDDVAGLARPKTLKPKLLSQKILDELSVTTEKTIEEVSPLLDAGGRAIKRETIKKSKQELMPSLTSPSVRKILKETLALPDDITFKHAQRIRSKILKTIREGESTQKFGKDTSAVFKRLSKAYNDSMSDAAKGLSKEANTTWRAVNEIYKQGQELYNDDFIVALMKKNPELAVDSIFKPRNITNIRKVKKVLGKSNKETWNKMGASYLKKTLEAGHFGDPTKKGAAKALQEKFRNIGDDSLELIFDDPTVYKGIKRVLDSAVLSEDKGLSTGASVAIKLAQFGAGAALFTGTETEGGQRTALAILIGPSVLAKLMTSRMGVKWLSEGLLQEAGTQRGGQIISKLMAFAAKEELTEPNKDKEVLTSTTKAIPSQGGRTTQTLRPREYEPPKKPGTLSDLLREGYDRRRIK